VAENAAGVAGKPVTYGPFRIADPSVPTTPEFCTGLGAGSALAVQMNKASSDDETGITGYAYRVRNAAGTVVRGWPINGAVDWPSKGVPNSIMLEKPFAPAQLVTAIANLLNTGTPSP